MHENALSLVDRVDRVRIRDLYKIMFSERTKVENAKRLGISEKSVGRLMAGENVPNLNTAKLMQQEIDSGRAQLALSEEELREKQDKERLEREKQQKRIRLRLEQDDHDHPEPAWHLRSIDYLMKGKPQIVVGILEDRLDPEQPDWEAVPVLVRPHALNNLGMAHQRLGEHPAADECYARALEALPGIPVGQQRCGLEALIRSNRATALLQNGLIKKAKKECSIAARLKTGLVEPVFNGLCVAAALADEKLAINYVGRLTQLAQILSDEPLRNLIRHLDDDPDLRWLRQKTWWDDFTNEVRDNLAK